MRKKQMAAPRFWPKRRSKTEEEAVAILALGGKASGSLEPHKVPEGFVALPFHGDTIVAPEANVRRVPKARPTSVDLRTLFMTREDASRLQAFLMARGDSCEVGQLFCVPCES